MSTTIPTKLYITYKTERSGGDCIKLGFASPYTKDAAFEKRKKTQDSWAYGGSVQVDIDDDDCVSLTGAATKSLYGSNSVADAGTIMMSNMHPTITNNELVEGFEISKSVRRSGWHGGGNTVWRIVDPRGFELEISSDNFARIVDCSTIINGVIQGKCLWGRNGQNNILLPEMSDVYQEAISLTIKQDTTRIPIKNITLGSTVDVMIKAKTYTVAQYLGKYYALSSRCQDDSKAIIFNSCIEEIFVFKNDEQGYFLIKSPKFISVLSTPSEPLNREATAHDITAAIGNGHKVLSSNTFIVSHEKISPANVRISLEEVDLYVHEAWPKVFTHSVQGLICKVGNEYGIAANVYNKGVSTPVVNKCTLSLENCTIYPTYTTSVNAYGMWGASRTLRQAVQFSPADTPDLNLIPKYKIKAEVNGITGYVQTLHVYYY